MIPNFIKISMDRNRANEVKKRFWGFPKVVEGKVHAPNRCPGILEENMLRRKNLNKLQFSKLSILNTLFSVKVSSSSEVIPSNFCLRNGDAKKCEDSRQLQSVFPEQPSRESKLQRRCYIKQQKRVSLILNSTQNS